MLKRTSTAFKGYDGPTFAQGERVWAEARTPFRRPDDAEQQLIRVLSGIVGLYAVGARGNRLIVALRFPGEIIPPATLGALGIWPLIRSELDVTHEHAGIRELTNQFIRDLSIAHEWLAQSRAGAFAVTAHLLCEIATRGRFGTEKIPNMLTQAQLADITGQTSVNVNRVFADMEQRSLIARENGDIIFKDWAELCRVGNFSPEYLEAGQ